MAEINPEALDKYLLLFCAPCLDVETVILKYKMYFTTLQHGEEDKLQLP